MSHSISTVTGILSTIAFYKFVTFRKYSAIREFKKL